MTRIGAIAALGLAWLVAAQGIAFAAAGDLDPTFDRNGKRVLESQDAVANVALVQPNSRIVVAGYAIHDDTGLVARLRPNGALDQSFGDGGFVDQPFQQLGIQLIGGDAALQDDGDIVAAGYSDKGFATVRLLPDGSIDPSFSDDGFAHTTFGVHLTGVHGGDTVSGVAMDGSDIVVAGDADSHHWALVRYLPDGTRDSTFGSSGKAITSISGISTDVLVQPDGKIVVCGFNTGSVIVLRYLPNGSLDPGFGSNGRAILPLGPSGNDAPSRMVLGPDGTILVAGFSFEGLFGVLRLTAAGELDDTFGDGGVTTTSFGTGHTAHAVGLVVQEDGKIVAAGCRLARRQAQSALARYLPDGSPDPTFGDNGKVITFWDKPSDGQGCAADIALTPDGRLVTAGGVSAPPGSDHMAVARYLAS